MQLFLVACNMCNYIRHKDNLFTSGNHKTICQCKIHGICHVKMTWIYIIYYSYINDHIFFLLVMSWCEIHTIYNSQIYRLHGFISNPCKIYYFMGSYYLHTNVIHYLNTKVSSTTFVSKQYEHAYDICV